MFPLTNTVQTWGLGGGVWEPRETLIGSEHAVGEGRQRCGGWVSLGFLSQNKPSHTLATFLKHPHFLMLLLLHKLAISSTNSKGLSWPRP